MTTEQNPTSFPFEGGSGGSESFEIFGAEQSFEDLTMDDFMAFPTDDPVTPTWKKTRYPVDLEQFKTMNQRAMERQLEPLEMQADGAGDEGDDVTIVEEDFPEGSDDSSPEAFSPEDQAPRTEHSFRGIPATGWQPPDCTMGVGPNDVVLGANVEMAGYRKNGSLRFRWPNFTTLFRNVTPAGAGLFDPQIVYDHYSRRWIAILAAKRDSPRGSWCMLGVSQTADPAGRWWVWALNASVDGSSPSNNWMDYPMLGFDTQAIYIGMNQFQFGGGFAYSKLRILKKSEVYAGGVGPSHNIRWYDYWNLKNPDGSQAFTVLPCRHYRGTGGNPAAYLINALWPSGNKLTLWTLSNPVAYWSGGSPSLSKTSVSCRAYDLPPDAVQRGSSNPIQTNDSRLLSAIFQYVNGTKRIWTTHTDRGTWSGDTAARSVIQWYEIDVPSKRVIQQNAYGARGMYYFFPAIHTDIDRNAYLVFSRCSASQYVQLRQTGRRVTGATNDLESSRLVKAGESAYTGNRWGDYFGICRDGGDNRRVWGYGEYAAQRGRWGTWVFSARY